MRLSAEAMLNGHGYEAIAPFTLHFQGGIFCLAIHNKTTEVEWGDRTEHAKDSLPV